MTDPGRERPRPRSPAQTERGLPRPRNRISHPQIAQETLNRPDMRLVLQHWIVQPADLDTAVGALCPDGRIEFAGDRSAEGLGFQHHDPRGYTNDVIELERPSRPAENDIVKRGEPDPL